MKTVNIKEIYCEQLQVKLQQFSGVAKGGGTAPQKGEKEQNRDEHVYALKHV